MPKKKKPEKKEDRKQKFIEECAKGVTPYRAALNAGYSEKTAKVKSCKMVRQRLEKIEELKPIVQQAIQEQFKYTVQESFNKLNEIQELALLKDEKGNYTNLNAAIKAEELKGKMYGVYEADNSQRAPGRLQIKVLTKDEKDEE